MVSPTFGYAPVPALAAEAELGNDEQQQLQPSSTSTTTTTTHTSTTTTSSVEEDDPRSDTQGDFTCSSFPASTLPHHSRLLLCLVLAAVLAGLVLVGVIGVAVGFSFSLSSSHAGRSDLLPVTPGRILVVFVHLAGQPFMLLNLEYFVQKAVRCWQDADYVIIVQHNDADTFLRNSSNLAWKDGLPLLPPNARYLLHENRCVDWGSFGWLLSLPSNHSAYVDTARYRYFALLNSGVRGPLLPDFLEQQMDPYSQAVCDGRQLPGLFSWYDMFLTKMAGAVHYVGCTLNCQFAPHVQSYAVFMDHVALQVLWRLSVPNDWMAFEPSNSTLRNASRALRVEERWEEWHRTGGLASLPQTGNVLLCHASKDDAIMVGEIGSSQAILRAGYNVAVMMRTWAGVDFRAVPSPCDATTNARGWDAQVDPLHNGAAIWRTLLESAKISLDPLEVVFGKRKGGDWPSYHARLEALLSWENDTWTQGRKQLTLQHPTRSQGMGKEA